MKRVDFSVADLAKCDFREAIFSGSSLREANLVDARFEGADLRGADLGGIRLDDARKFKGATISREQAGLSLPKWACGFTEFEEAFAPIMSERADHW